jgi:hypothetical protein
MDRNKSPVHQHCIHSVLQILKKRQAQEQHQRRRSLRARNGRRVSFAPDEELETMHLFKVVSCASCARTAVDPINKLIPLLYADWVRSALQLCSFAAYHQGN